MPSHLFRTSAHCTAGFRRSRRRLMARPLYKRPNPTLRAPAGGGADEVARRRGGSPSAGRGVAGGGPMAAAAAEASRSGPSADSYIGSLISLTSKSEIRYEGVLFNINTEESSIGLRNVRSFGTEARKKDGPQIPPSDKIYEYILFRGSDIKDLQVKSSPPVQATPSIPNDPAIIQSHYSRPVAPASVSASLPSTGSGTIPEVSSHIVQVEAPRSTFQSGLPLHQPAGTLGTWGSSPPPMYWQGYYPPSGGMPHLQQLPLLRPPGPPPGLPVPPSMQQPLQYPGIINSSLPSGSHTLPGASVSLSSGSPNLSGLSASPPSTTALPGSSVPFSSGISNLSGISTSVPTMTSNLPGVSVAQPSGSTILPSSVSLSSASILPEFPLLPPVGSSISLTSPAFPSSGQATNLIPDTPATLLPNKNSISSLPSTTPGANSTFLSPITSSIESLTAPTSGKPKVTLGTDLAYQTSTQPASSVTGTSSSDLGETSVPSLLTPGQLLQSGSSTVPSTWKMQTSQKPSESKPVMMEPQRRTSVENRNPILPLPTASDQKQHGASFHTHHSNRGRGRGRGNTFARNVTKFTEDFDFMAMNEKFKKDEVWGHLGKSRVQVRDGEGDTDEEEIDDLPEEDYPESSTVKAKPMYVKDDFFDSLSCNALDHGERNGRVKFSEQLKIDTETFGDFSRYRPGRGGGRGFRGGGRTRGFYYGRGYGYVGRGGRGHHNTGQHRDDARFALFNDYRYLNNLPEVQFGQFRGAIDLLKVDSPVNCSFK
ncbi:hypothetical protein Taro_052293, partial [Colocasia esculenta]|nr:hypothetical protein [Colocasia esculenta]